MINKYKESYSAIILALVELHNAHLDYLEGPNERKAKVLRKQVRALIPNLKSFVKMVTCINKEVRKRTQGTAPRIPNDPALLTTEFHEWVGKGLNRVYKYTPKRKKK